MTPFLALITPLGGGTGIWGPNDPRPTPPIYWPGYPGGGGGGGQPPHIWGPPDMPPGFWGGGMGPGVRPQPHPEHPIVIPPPPVGSGTPEHPINKPPDVEPPEGYDWVHVYVPFPSGGGWMWTLAPEGEQPPQR